MINFREQILEAIAHADLPQLEIVRVFDKIGFITIIQFSEFVCRVDIFLGTNLSSRNIVIPFHKSQYILQLTVTLVIGAAKKPAIIDGEAFGIVEHCVPGGPICQNIEIEISQEIEI